MSLAEQLKTYRLNQDEYDRICKVLGRTPEGVEWALFSALWSEHCSYKSSRIHLKKFNFRSSRVLQSFGENAGVIDLGEGERVAFKMESHNHPSFIEPYQGAATGVGGILRDIFTMGARPVALGNYLCFGSPEASRMSTLVDGVVRGISGYGNCVGVPTMTGQVEFHESYNSNILVNAFALGLFRPGEPVVTSKAHGVGNYVVYVGAKTGRDGIHGASMASESFDDKSESKRPTVQIGDPFYEKLLIESCIEVMAKDLVVAIQDMGAAGLTSSSFEMAAKGGIGLRLDLDKVPLRDETLTPEDILLSESQERMLLICEPLKFEALMEVFHRWDLDAVVIGEIIEDRQVELWWRGDRICKIDPNLLTDEAPQYDRPYDKWQPRHRVNEVKVGDDSKSELLAILKDPMGCSRQWVYQQYDQRVGGKTVQDAANPVAVIRLPDSGRGLGIVLGCRPHVMRFDAREGALDAVIYPSLELAAKGFTPLALTDCLNYGNPERKALMTELVASIDALAEVSRGFEIPVISGNVSLYNETMNKNVTSTPSTGLVGLRSSVDEIPDSHFSVDGEEIWLLRSEQLVINGLEGERLKAAPQGIGKLEVARSRGLVDCLLAMPEGLVSSSRVVGKFGIGYTLARMCLGGLGCKVDLKNRSLFSEALYEVVLCVPAGTDMKNLARSGLEFSKIGAVGGTELVIENKFRISVSELQTAYTSGWEETFEELGR